MKVNTCRACNSKNLINIHDFGEQPLAGDYPIAPNSVSPAKKYPLDLTQCCSCGLLQVTNLPPIKNVFHENYRYASSTIPSLVRHFTEFAQWISELLPSGAKIFEFGCNDGVLLEKLQSKGFYCEGVDASENVAAIARSKNINVTTGFLTKDFVKSIEGVEKFDMVTCSNVFAHIHDLLGTLEAVQTLLKKNGLFIIEVHDGKLLSLEGQFDTVYHEHLSYFNEETLRSLLEQSGFEFINCKYTDMHGGGIRLLSRNTEKKTEQKKENIYTYHNYDFIAPAIEQCKIEIKKLYYKHGPLIGYGAAGRSQMFINFTKANDYFSVIYDDSPFRQSRYITGTDIPIKAYNNSKGNCAVILAWNYAQDISKKIHANFKEIVTLLPVTKNW